MISRDQALALLSKYIKTENTIKHMIATEAIMGELAKKFAPEDEAAWRLSGLLHDIDYEVIDQETKANHGKRSVEILKEEGVDLPESVNQTILAHVHDMYDDVPQPADDDKMGWSLFICDSLTGLIVATALVRPSKKLADVKVKSVLKKFKQPSFAAGTRREEIAMCEDKLGIPLRDFVELSLNSLKAVSNEIGL